MAKKIVVSPFPIKLGDCVDLAYKLRAERQELERDHKEKLDKLKEKEEKLKQHIIGTFKKSEINGAKGKICTAAITTLDKYRPADFMAVFEWARKYNQPQIFEKRLAQKAMQELVENKITVPGVETYTIIDLSLTKVG